MYLKKLELKNFRKFRTENNIVEFVDAESYQKQNEGGKIDISSITTLIVGKNNSGKTTITKALEKIIKGNKFEANDFNFSYLKDKLNEYEKEIGNIDGINVDTPLIEFKLIIGIQNKNNDLVTNLVPFMTLDNVEMSELDILVKYELVEKETFQHDVIQLLSEDDTDEIKRELKDNIRFKKFLELIENSTDFKTRYYSASGDNVQFKMEDLIEITSIKANNVDNDRCLSKAFSKIVEFRYKSTLGKNNKKNLESEIEKINIQLSTSIAKDHTESINNSLGAIVSSDKLEMFLSTDITLKNLMTNFIKYEYVEQGYNIPETQFGLGYTNLMMIIAELIEYMEKYPEQSFNSKVNLISIEEPETFMHPQMQELFIKHINEAISSLLLSNRKSVNSQLIITTHSSHILNSKIHSGNTFNNINYITTKNNSSHVVALNDENIMPNIENDEEKEKDRENDLKFLKKHIKYKVSELFFSDAIIFVEGITEETLIRYYIDNDETLNKFYISIFNIGGAHALVYHELIKLLKVPALIITDLDIKRTPEEKKKEGEEAKKSVFNQITTLKNRETTNNTIKKYNDNKYSIEELDIDTKINNLKLSYKGMINALYVTSFKKEILMKTIMGPIDTHVDNLKLSYQGKKINGFYATSFEEAYILTNFKNDILKKAIEKLKPGILKGIIGKDDDVEQMKNNSYKLQRKLSGSKSDFANKLLYEFIIADKGVELPVLPTYILDGLTWLSEKLTGGTEK